MSDDVKPSKALPGIPVERFEPNRPRTEGGSQMASLGVKTHISHHVSGQVELEQTYGELEYIGMGGMIVRSKRELAKGAELRMIRFTISGYSGVFIATGRVVGTFIGLSAIMFLGEPTGLQDFLDQRFGEICHLDRTDPQRERRSSWLR
jgi:hypothetical protein